MGEGKDVVSTATCIALGVLKTDKPINLAVLAETTSNLHRMYRNRPRFDSDCFTSQVLLILNTDDIGPMMNA